MHERRKYRRITVQRWVLLWTGSGTKYYFREMNKYPRNVSVWRCACCGRCFPFSRLTTYLLSCSVSVSVPFSFSYFLYPGGYIREEKEVVSIQRNSLGERNGWMMMMMMIHEQKLRSISCCGTFSGAVNPGVVGGGFCVKWSVTLGKFDSFFYSNKCWIFRIWILLNGEWWMVLLVNAKLLLNLMARVMNYPVISGSPG